MRYLINKVVQPARFTRLAESHPGLLGALLLVGLPVGLLGAVCVTTLAIMGPVALLMGWPII